MDGGVIVFIILVWFVAIGVYGVIARGRERAREWEGRTWRQITPGLWRFEDKYLNPTLPAVLELGLGLGMVAGGVWGIIAPWVTDVALWWPTLLGVITLLVGIFCVAEGVGNYRGRNTVERAGIVTRKRTINWETHTAYKITVSEVEYDVSPRLYDSVAKGNEIVLKMRAGWYSDGAVIAFRHGTASTGRVLPVLHPGDLDWEDPGR